MRTLLRDIVSGQYFQALEKWTSNREEAYDFGRVTRAVNVAHKLHLEDAELVLSFEQAGEKVPSFSQLVRGLSGSRRRKAAHA